MIKTLAPVSAAILLAGCVTTHSRIADLKYNPARYQHHSVTVQGVVTSAWGIPLVPVKLYRVDDGTGEVTIVSNHGTIPTKGARVRVTGRVNDVATIGGQAVGLHLEEERVHLKY